MALDSLWRLADELQYCFCREQLKKTDWRKAYSADAWFSEGGLVLGGRSRKDASWYRSLVKPEW